MSTLGSVIAPSATAAALAYVSGVALGSRRARRTERLVGDAAVDLATAADLDEVVTVTQRAVRELVPPRSRPGIRVGVARDGTTATPSVPAGQVPAGQVPAGLVPVVAVRSDGTCRIGALLVEPATAARPRIRAALETLSVHAALAVRRLRQAQETVRLDRGRYFDALSGQTSDVVLIVDDDDRIRHASLSAPTIFGTPALTGVPFTDLVAPAERRPAEFLLRHARAGPHPPAGTSRADWTIHARDGRRVNVEASCRASRADEPVSGLIVTLRDVTAQRHLEQELTRQAFHDSLTGLPNRLLFRERVIQALATQPGLAAVFLLDLDDFRAINEAAGHRTGDAVLIEVGARLRDAVGRYGVAARLGDDEFAALIPGLTGTEPDEVTARVAGRLAEPVPVPGGPLTCTASVGVATSAIAADPQELLRHADLALGAAKAAGRGRWRQYDSSVAGDRTDRAGLRAALGRAVHDDALALEYQPIVALDTGRTVGFEALLRWQHPTRGQLFPDQFIHLAEESGLILPIGEWVLRTAMAAARRWTAVEPGQTPFVSINVSARQLRSGGFVDTVHRSLVATGLSPGQLILEVTESLLLHDDEDGEAAWRDLQRLRMRGVRVAIDDFGTGYSSLGYLRHAPLDIVKLDRLFISPLTTSHRQRELVAGIVRLARGLSLDTVAEGIETAAQREIAAGLGCGYGQGFLFSRPVSDPMALPGCHADPVEGGAAGHDVRPGPETPFRPRHGPA